MLFSPLPESFMSIRRRFIWSVVSLGVRGSIGKVISVGSLILLSRWLEPTDFGLFAILQLPVGWLNLIADAGISAALVQRHTLSCVGEQTGFTLRLLFSGILVAGIVSGASLIGQLYNLPTTTSNLLRLLALGPLIGAFGTIATVRLTRALRFDQLALAELGSLVSGQAVALFLAFNGFGLFSLVAGALTSAAAGTLLVNLIAPWSPRFGLAVAEARQLLRFGAPYQGQGLVHLAKDQAVPALSGLFFTAAQTGYLNWSQDIARLPRLPADYVSRAAFPAFSRLQRDPASINRLLQLAATTVLSLSLSAVSLAVILAPVAIRPVFGEAWQPALPALTLFLLQTPFDAMAALLLPAIYASGLVKRGLSISVVWAGVTWFLSLLLLKLWGDWRSLPLAFCLSTLVGLLLITRHLPDGVEIRWSRCASIAVMVAIPLAYLAYRVRLGVSG